MPQLSVEVDRLHAHYGTNHVLNGIDLHVAAAEVVALLGPSGCGKTTLLRCIAGLERPSQGAITIGDVLVTEGRGVPPERRHVGMVFQDGALFPHRSVLDNVTYGLPRAERGGPRGLAALRLVELDGKADRAPGTLSGGEQQRVAVARALAPEPGVLLLDEPFSNLDAALRVQLRVEVRRLLKDIGVTALLVTHDQDEALMFGDRVAVMRAGSFEQVGTPAEVYERPATQWVARFVGEANLLAAHFSDWSASTELGRLPLYAPATGDGTVMVRPEQLALEPGEGAVVHAVTYEGRDTQYELVLATGTRLSARVTGVPRHATGDAVAPRFTGTAAQAWPGG